MCADCMLVETCYSISLTTLTKCMFFSCNYFVLKHFSVLSLDTYLITFSMPLLVNSFFLELKYFYYHDEHVFTLENRLFYYYHMHQISIYYYSYATILQHLCCNVLSQIYLFYFLGISFQLDSLHTCASYASAPYLAHFQKQN